MDEKYGKYEAIVRPLAEQHDGRIAAYPVGRHGVWVVRASTGSEQRRHTKLYRLHEENKNKEGIDGLAAEFAKACTVYPTDIAAIDAIIEDYPTLVVKVFRRIQELSGDEVQEVGKG